MDLVWTRAARADVIALWDDLEQHDPRAAELVESRILDSVEQLRDFPYIGRPGAIPATRELVVSRTRYRVVYAVEPGRVAILRVVHGARDWPPGSNPPAT